jgi:integral membrane protein (TIGR00529 family)
MIVLLKLLIVVTVFVVLVMRRLDLGGSILISSILLGLLFQLPAAGILESLWLGATQLSTIDLVAIILLILLLGNLLGETGNLRNTAAALEELIRDRRITLVLPPALIGLIPMPGGAMLSAPMVEEGGRRMQLTPEMKTFINYWFRHLWEYFWPLYPGLIIGAAILEVPITRMMAAQYPISAVAIIAGLLLGVRRLPKPPTDRPTDEGMAGNRLAGLRILVASIWPIVLVLILVLGARLPMVVALSLTIISVILAGRVGWRRLAPLLKRSLSGRTVLVLVAVMIFKRVLEASGAVELIPGAFEQLGVPPALLLVLAPFAVGILTGVNQAYVGVSFPMLIPLMGGATPDFSLVMLAYVSGFVGVLLSPVHLCLLLTKNYYGAHYPTVYRHLIPAAAIVQVGAFALLAVYVYL